MQARFSNVLSSQFTVGNGVKQGGVLSPILCAVFLESLIKTLKQKNHWLYNWQQNLRSIWLCRCFDFFMSHFTGLQEMLNVCEDFAKDYNILFNATKVK